MSPVFKVALGFSFDNNASNVGKDTLYFALPLARLSVLLAWRISSGAGENVKDTKNHFVQRVKPIIFVQVALVKTIHMSLGKMTGGEGSVANM